MKLETCKLRKYDIANPVHIAVSTYLIALELCYQCQMKDSVFSIWMKCLCRVVASAKVLKIEVLLRWMQIKIRVRTTVKIYYNAT